MLLKGLITARLNKPGRKARVVGWNLLFLLWAGMLLVGLTHADLLGGRAFDAVHTPQVAAASLPEAEPLAGALLLPLTIPADDARALQAEAVAPAAPLEPPAPPDYPRVGAAYANPGYDPAGGMQEYRQSPLAWLTHHQNAEGFWSAAYFGDNSCREGAAITGQGDAGESDGDLTATSLALLSYVGAGYDHKEGDFKRNIRQAILWLRKDQREYGFASARGVRDHALAVSAISEAYGLSGDAVLKPIADAAIKQLIDMRDSEGGWGEIGGAIPDMISTAYAVLALKSAKMSGLEFDDSLPGLSEWIDSMYEDRHVSYNRALEAPPGSTHETLTRPPVCAAAWLLVVLLRGLADPEDERVKQSATLLAQADNLPLWERGRIDFEYWWLGSMATFQAGGKTWKAWEPALSSVLLDNQRGFTAEDKTYGLTETAKLDEHGSWDAEDIWCTDGRVATTAMAALCLEVYYRYQRLDETVVEDE